MQSNTCKIEGCSNKPEYRGVYKGVRSYRKLCEVHRRPGRQRRTIFDMTQCNICTSSIKTQRHRYGGVGTEYKPGNVIVLCEKCHVKVHAGKMNLDEKRSY